MVEHRLRIFSPKGTKRDDLTNAAKMVLNNRSGRKQTIDVSNRPEEMYELESDMKLVPCRWSRTGWKYVEQDPREHKFFGQPNRANAQGFFSPQSRKTKGTGAFAYTTVEDDSFLTTNQKYHSGVK